ISQASLTVFQVIISAAEGLFFFFLNPMRKEKCSRWRNKTSSAVSGTQVLAERSSREGSAQRMPRQPSASRLQKAGASGKNSGGNST
uniref:Uncharacterized protein n=1 Tax=Apteryx owenii TaxID=8824 RepID=A0A8B9P1A8_APTOW